MKIFEEGPVQSRMASYGSIVDDLTILVFGRGKPLEKRIAPNVLAIAPGGAHSIGAFFALRRELVTQTSIKRYDLMSSQDPFFVGALALTVSRHRKIPLQIQLHTDCFSSEFIFASPRRVIEALIARIIIPRASCIRTVSERIRKSVKRFTTKPISILPIHPSYTGASGAARPPAFKNRHHIITVSRLTKEKQLELVIDAVALVPNVDLVIVGEGPEKQNLSKRREERRLVGRVHFVGWQDPAPYYEHASMFVQASRFEGYGMALIEAALAGLPIITTDVGVVGEVLHAGKEALVVPATPESIATAITRFIEEPEFAKRLGENAKQNAETHVFSEGAYLEAYRKVLQTCLS